MKEKMERMERELINKQKENWDILVQAKNDETLGNEHFDLLKEHFEEIAQIEVLEDMPHTARVDVKERRVILEKWFSSITSNR